MAVTQQNRFAEAILAAIGTSATLIARTTYAMARGELAYATDTKRLYVADSNTTGGDFRRVHGLDMLVTFEGSIVCHRGEAVWKER